MLAEVVDDEGGGGASGGVIDGECAKASLPTERDDPFGHQPERSRCQRRGAEAGLGTELDGELFMTRGGTYAP